MDLKTFVSESICQICSGIIDAQKRTEKTNAIVSPTINHTSDGKQNISKNEKAVGTASTIHFDVALSAIDSSGSGKKGAKRAILEVMNVRLEAGFSSGNESTAMQEMASVSRIQFDVPIVWPHKSPKRE